METSIEKSTVGKRTWGSPALATGREDLSSLSAYPYQGVEPRTISQLTLGGRIPTARLPPGSAHCRMKYLCRNMLISTVLVH